MASVDAIQESSSQQLAPLPLVPFERMMLADDHPAYPMLFVFEFRFTGQVEQQAWQASWTAALERHPFLTGLVDPRTNRWHWRAGAKLPTLHWIECEEFSPENFPAAIDLTARPGIEGWLRQTPGEARFSCHFHHACCDGMGAMRFFEDMFLLYSQCVSNKVESSFELRTLDPSRLPARATYGLKPAPILQQVRDTVCGVSEAWKFLRPTLQRLAPVRKQNPDFAPPAMQAGFCSFVLDESTLQGLRTAAAAGNGTLNDLLLRDLFLVVQNWSTQHDAAEAKNPVRIMMPCNMRLAEDVALPATNVVSYAFLTRQVAQAEDAASLMESVRAETKLIRDLRLALYFAGALGTALAIPFGMRTILSPKFCMATAYMSNLGDLSRLFLTTVPREQGKFVIGNLLLTDLAIIPPVRKNTRVGVVVVNIAGKLKFCVRLDPHLFTDSDVNQFVELFRNQLLKTAAT